MSKKDAEARKREYFDDKPKNFDWYQRLRKSPLNPPSWVFPIAWTILYVMIGISGYKFLRTTNFELTKGLLVYGGQVVLNLIWSPLFFRMKKPGWAFVDILLLWGMIAWNISEFGKIDDVAAKLLYPYFAWVTFATYLNGYIVFKN